MPYSKEVDQWGNYKYTPSENQKNNDFVKWLDKNIGNPVKKFFSGDALSEVWNGLTGQTSAQATRDANERNIANQNYWNAITMQREDTAHQREVADLQAAGLNPWLSMGNGAQSVGLQTAQVDPVDGSKILSATSAAALLAITKLLLKKI